MGMDCSKIMAILQENRVDTAPKVQEILTKYGCHIRLRLGLHEAQVDSCSNSGLILLQLCGDRQETAKLETELQAVPHVKVKSMMLDF
ncbi:MAG: hypothetical protein H6Q75_1379 [Firmicutes bacterium]|nr:hypothetical protein [Bacillota bacterium]